MISGFSPLGDQFTATNTSGSDFTPSLSGLDDGGFVLTFYLGFDDVFAQRFDADGNKVGGDFRVNSPSSNEQSDPLVTTLGDGSYVVTWQSFDQDGSNMVSTASVTVPTATRTGQSSASIPRQMTASPIRVSPRLTAVVSW